MEPHGTIEGYGKNNQKEKQNSNIVFRKSDKSYKFVIINKQDYFNKLNIIVRD